MSQQVSDVIVSLEHRPGLVARIGGIARRFGHGVAAIHAQIGAGYKRGPARGQKDTGVADFGGLPQPVQRRAGEDVGRVRCC